MVSTNRLLVRYTACKGMGGCVGDRSSCSEGTRFRHEKCQSCAVASKSRCVLYSGLGHQSYCCLLWLGEGMEHSEASRPAVQSVYTTINVNAETLADTRLQDATNHCAAEDTRGPRDGHGQGVLDDMDSCGGPGLSRKCGAERQPSRTTSKDNPSLRGSEQIVRHGLLSNRT